MASTLYHVGRGDSDSIQCLHVTREGKLFVGTMTGFHHFENETFSVVIPDLWTSRIEEAADGNLLVITSKGFVEWDGNQIIQHLDLPARLGVRQNEIFRVSEDPLAPVGTARRQVWHGRWAPPLSESILMARMWCSV